MFTGKVAGRIAQYYSLSEPQATVFENHVWRPRGSRGSIARLIGLSRIWIAVLFYVLVAIVKKRLARLASLFEILQIS